MKSDLDIQTQDLINFLGTFPQEGEKKMTDELTALFDVGKCLGKIKLDETLAAATTASNEKVDVMVNTNIIPRFSTNDHYTGSEQAVINHALNILASKLVNQEVANHFTTAQSAVTFFQLKLATSDREIFAVMYLNNENRLISYEELDVGTLDAASVYPREIIKRALKLNAANIILSHNHPSGKATPSTADIRLTAVIEHCAQLFGIHVLDHIVVGIAETTSFKQMGISY